MALAEALLVLGWLFACALIFEATILPHRELYLGVDWNFFVAHIIEARPIGNTKMDILV